MDLYKIRTWTLLLIAALSAGQMSCSVYEKQPEIDLKEPREKQLREIEEKLIVKTSYKKAGGKIIVDFLFATPIYFGESGVLIEHGEKSIEIQKGIFEDKPLIVIKDGETSKYRVEVTEKFDISKPHQIVVTDKSGEEFKGDIKLNEKEYLTPVKSENQ